MKGSSEPFLINKIVIQGILMKLWFGFEHIPLSTTRELKTFIQQLKVVVGSESSYVYFDDAHNYASNNTQLTIKVTNAALLSEIAKSSKLAPYKFVAKTGGQEFKATQGVNAVLYLSGGIRGTGKLPRKGEAMSSPTTKQQETGTVEYFLAKFAGKKPTIDSISEKVKFDFGQDWWHSFEQQYAAFEAKVGKISDANVYLDSGINDSNILIKLARKFGLKDSKDNWNPADIWVMTVNPAKIEKDTAKFTSLTQFNAYMKTMFVSKKIIGLSLKKVDQRSKGKYEVIESDTLPDVNLKPYRVLYSASQTNFVFETQGNIKNFMLRVGYKAGTITSESDIRVYLEGRVAGTGVQMGAVSSQLFPELAKEQGFDIVAMRPKILKDPAGYLAKFLKEISKSNYVEIKSTDFSKLTPVQLQASAFLAYYLLILLNSDPSILNACYYSSAKMNNFSCIHGKLS